MDVQKVLEYQERLVKNYKYRPLPTLQQEEARRLYRENLPEGFCLDGADAAVFASTGMKLCNRYNRIVVGDYGAYVEILPDDMVHENIRVKPGQEYRDQNPRYSGNVTFSWLTTKDDSDVKIQFQKKEVAHADMVPGRYYVSVYECVPQKVAEKEQTETVTRDAVVLWLKKHGAFSEELTDYCFGLGANYGDALACAVRNDVEPHELSYWLCVCDACADFRPLSFEQFQTISYNLLMIGFTSDDVGGKLETLAPEVRVAIELGLEGLAMPYELQSCSPEMIRELLKFSAEGLLVFSRFSKVIAGHKAENMELLGDVDSVIADANGRVREAASRYKDYQHEMA